MFQCHNVFNIQIDIFKSLAQKRRPFIYFILTLSLKNKIKTRLHFLGKKTKKVATIIGRMKGRVKVKLKDWLFLFF